MNQEAIQEHKPLTAEELLAIRARAEKASPGPWVKDTPIPGVPRAMIADLVGWFVYPTQSGVARSVDDADFIANARTDVPRLLATITAQSRLIALAETLVGAVADWVESPDSISKAMDLMLETAEAFTAALTEYQTTGAVPCGECEVKAQQLAYSDKVDEEKSQTIIDLATERDDLRRQLAEAQADNAAFLAFIEGDAPKMKCECGSPDADCARCNEFLAITDGDHPGAPLLEEVEALRKVVEDLPEIARCVDAYGTDGERLTLAEMQQTLDAIRNREGR